MTDEPTAEPSARPTAGPPSGGASGPGSGSTSGGPTSPGEVVTPVHVAMTKIVNVGIALWALGLLVTLLVPALHEGPRDWWPWCCVAGIVLGGIGLVYLRRGRGNAADA